MMRSSFLAAAVAAAIMFAAPASAFAPGPAIGAAAPAPIAANDQTAKLRTFADLAGPGGLVLVFNRSVDWCPVCQKQMIELNDARAEIEKRGFGIAVVTTDPTEKLAAFAKRRDIGFALLADPDKKLIDAFQLRDPAFPPGHRIHGVPIPSIFIVGADGKVASKMGDLDYRKRPAAGEVVARVDAVLKAAR
jgi:peroxiredoxin